MKYINFILILFSFCFLSCKDEPAKGLGLTNSNTFHPCPKSANCVSSFENPNNETHYIKPIKYFLPKQITIKKIRKIIQNDPKAKIVESSDIYIRAEYTSTIFSFVDDIQFYFGIKNIVHIRSASRNGFSDFGKNRKRVREIEFALQQSGL